MEKINIMYLEDNSNDVKLVQALLKEGEVDFNMNVVVTQEEYEKGLKDSSLNIIFSDYMLPTLDGFLALKLAKQHRPELPFLLISGVIGEEKVIEVFKAGVTDFILKQHLQRLIPAISRALTLAKERKKREMTEIALRESETHYRTIANVSLVGIFKMDAQGKLLTYANQRAQEITGYDEKSLMGQGWTKVVHPGDREKTRTEWGEAIKKGLPYQSEVHLLLPDGTERWAMCQAAPQFDSNKNITGYIGAITDITELKKVQYELQKLARYDQITDLPNRVLFEETFSRALTKTIRNNGSLAVFYIDLDNFKYVNDTLGHSTGDLLLKETGKILQKNARTQDFVARLGGDEFGILVEDFESEVSLYAIAKRIIQAFETPFHINNHEILSAASIGIAIYPKGGNTVESMIQHADQALYQAKAEGKKCFQFYNEAMQQQIERYVLIEKQLRHAIEKNEFEICYQPQIDILSQRVFGIEALLRWHNPHIGVIAPEEFILIAENSGLIHEIGYWIINTVLHQYSEWRKKDFGKWKDMNISLNLSPNQFLDNGIVDEIMGVLKNEKIDPSTITLELTETAITKKPDETKKIINELYQQGIGIAIDDFGIGYASLTYLAQLPIKVIKIDKSFTQKIGIDLNCEAIIKSIITLSQSLNLVVVAEGVETAEQLEFLKMNGCRIIQGFYFSSPLPTLQIENYVNQDLQG